MSVSESDLVLSAIRRGEETLPKLKAATGIGYAQLQMVLYNLEFERCSISRSESAEGFDRYYPSSAPQAEKKHIHAAPVVPLAYNLRTNAAADALEAALAQRAAPYCVKCKAVCLVYGTDRNGRPRWKCGSCNQTFLGSGEVNQVKKEKRDAAVALLKEGESPRKVAAEVGLAVQTVRTIREALPPTLCPCGEDAKHQGWCSYRFSQSPTRQETVRRMNMAHITETELKCEDCGGPRSPGSASRCHDCYQKKADARVNEIAGAGALPTTNYKVFDSSEQVESEPRTCWCGREIEAGCKGHGGRHRGRLKAKEEAAENGGGVLAAGLVTPSAPKVDVAKPRKTTGAKSAASDGFVRDVFCLRNCDPGEIGHHYKCTYFPVNQPSPSPVGEKLGLQESYQAILGELCSDRGALDRVIEIFKRERETGVRITETTRRSSPTSIQPAWPKYFEEDTDTATGEGQVGMSLFYLLSILHDSMEEHEKQAVWTLVQYMKRMQAASEASKADKLALST